MGDYWGARIQPGPVGVFLRWPWGVCRLFRLYYVTSLDLLDSFSRGVVYCDLRGNLGMQDFGVWLILGPLFMGWE